MAALEFVTYQPRSFYPHMGRADAEIWARYVAAHPTAFKEVAYDVPVGSGAEFDMTAGGILGPGMKKLYQRKIDAVLKDGGGVVLVEVKPRATTAAIGQLQGYAALWERDYPEYPVTQLLIVTDSKMPEMDFLTDRAGVQIAVV